jgi:hypothetical protein
VSRNKSIVVSFFTPDYKEYADRLRESLDRFRVPHDLEPMEDRPSFSEIVRQKPRFILEMAEKHKDEYDAVVWIDADAVVHAPLKLFGKIRQNLAVHYRDGIELLSGTMFWKTRYRALDILRQWASLCEDPNVHAPRICNLDCPEQQILQQMVAVSDIPVYHLPTEYCKIEGRTEMNDRGRKVVPVIVHHQASRQTRVRKP